MTLPRFFISFFVCSIYIHVSVAICLLMVKYQLGKPAKLGTVLAKLRYHTLCSCHMAPAKPTVCYRVVNFVRTVEHGEGTRWGVERSVNTLVAH